MWQQVGIRVYVVERDIYARQAIASYLSWDRRTKVIGTAGSVHEMITTLAAEPEDQRLNTVILDAGLATSPADLGGLIRTIRHHIEAATVVCLASKPDAVLALTAWQAGARCFLTRDQVGPGIAGAVRFALLRPFVATEDVANLLVDRDHGKGVTILPSRRHYPRLTPRVEQALWLCVLEGLPAELAAEEMGVSTSTVRSYIKEGYRILEADDETSYPSIVSPAERAFLRFTALNETDEVPTPWRPAA
jgi:DNA-binding NarL/FixJ family response regulator